MSASWWNSSANGWTPYQARPDLNVHGGSAFLMLLGLAMVGPLFSQSGWNNVTFVAGEVRRPGSNLPKALIKGTALVITLYLLANLAYIVTLPWDGIQKAPQDRVGTAMMKAIFGLPGGVIMAAAIMISTFGCNKGLILAGSRVYYAMARDRLFFSGAGSLNTNRVPAVALLTQCVWASLLTLVRTVTTEADSGVAVYGNVYTQLLEYIISADLVFYGLMAGAVIVMRRKLPSIDRPYRTLGYPFTPAIYIVVATLLILDLAYMAPATSGIGFLLVLSGIPVYLIWRRHGSPNGG